MLHVAHHTPQYSYIHVHHERQDELIPSGGILLNKPMWDIDHPGLPGISVDFAIWRCQKGKMANNTIVFDPSFYHFRNQCNFTAAATALSLSLSPSCVLVLYPVSSSYILVVCMWYRTRTPAYTHTCTCAHLTEKNLQHPID